jgi:hypothetical protein
MGRLSRGGGPDLGAYRDAVADLLLDIAGHTGPGDVAKAEQVLTERIGGAEIAAVLSATPEGTAAASSTSAACAPWAIPPRCPARTARGMPWTSR